MNREKIKETRTHYPGRLLLIKEDKSYRFYGGDALKAARDTGLALHNLVETPTFVSIPCAEAEKYLAALLGAGHKIVICEETAQEILKPKALPAREAPAIGTEQVNWPVEQKERVRTPPADLFR